MQVELDRLNGEIEQKQEKIACDGLTQQIAEYNCELM